MQGGRLTEPELARSAGTTAGGTEFRYLKRALRKHGYEPVFHKARSLRDVPVPCMVGVTVTGVGHVVVLLKTDTKGVTIGEPLRGRRTYSWPVFQRCYRPDGSYVVVKRIGGRA